MFDVCMSHASSGLQSVDGDDLRTEFEEALSLHQKGLIDLARDRYLRVLHEDPRHSDGLHLLGVIH